MRHDVQPGGGERAERVGLGDERRRRTRPAMRRPPASPPPPTPAAWRRCACASARTTSPSELRCGCTRVEPADAQRLLGADVAAGEDHLERAAAAEEMRQPGGAAGAGQDPHRHLGLAEHGAFAAVAEVERGEELGAATARGAVDARRWTRGGCDAAARTARRRRSARSPARARPAGWRGSRARRRASGRSRDRRSRTRRRAPLSSRLELVEQRRRARR